MPLYEYQCQGCQARLEVIQRFSDAALTECTDCGGELRKLISSPAIQFKGSGFYITDYARNGGASSSAKAETPASSPDGAGKSETPAAKAEPAASTSDTKTAAVTGSN